MLDPDVDYITMTVASIDAAMGEDGYARRNPSLIGSMLLAGALGAVALAIQGVDVPVPDFSDAEEPDPPPGAELLPFRRPA